MPSRRLRMSQKSCVEVWKRARQYCPWCHRSIAVVNWGLYWQFYNHKRDGEWCPGCQQRLLVLAAKNAQGRLF